MEVAPKQAMEASSLETRNRAVRKVKCYTLPVMIVLTITNYMDRGNIAYAHEGLKSFLGLNEAGYAAVAGSLFYTYVLFQWPHAWIASRLGVRRWLSFLAFLWGAATLAMAFIDTTFQLVLLRLVIGFAEAGSFPLLYMHLDSFLPAEDVAQCYSVLISSSQVASILSGPLAAGLVSIPLIPGLHADWQWLFIVEGSLAMLTACLVFACLMDSLEQTTLLSPEEKQALAKADGNTLAQGAVDWKAWYLGMNNILVGMPVYAFMFFSPKLIHAILGQGSSAAMADTLNAVPYLTAALFVLLIGVTSKLTGDRLYHCIIGMCLAAVLAFCFPLTMNGSGDVAAFLQLCLLYGMSSMVTIPMDTMPSAYCKNPVGSYSISNSLKSLSGIFGPLVFGTVNDFMDAESAVAVLGLCEVLAIILLIVFFAIVEDARPSFRCHKRKVLKTSQEPEDFNGIA